MKLNTLKMLFSIMMLIFCLEVFAQDEIFHNGFEPVPELFLDATPERILPGESTLLTWSVIDAITCIKSGDWSGFAMAGTGIFNEAVIPNSLPAHFSMQCSNQYGYSPIRTVIVEDDSPTSPPALIFTANPTDINLGETTTVTWTVAGAKSCVASTVSGFSDWVGVVNSTDGSHSRTVLINQLPSTLNLTCSNSVGQTSKSVQIIENVIVIGSAPTLNFTANPAAINLGGSTTLTWIVNNADNCTAFNSTNNPVWSGAKNSSNGVNSLVILGLTESTSFTLSCSNYYGNILRSVVVTVSNNPSNCSSSPPPANTFRDTQYLTFQEALASEFGSFNNAVADYDLTNQSYSALAFTTPSQIDSGNLVFYQPALPSYTSQNSTISISACPGDFENSLPSEICQNDLTDGNGNLRWTTDQSAPAFYCILQPGASYFLNIIHADSSNLSTTSCPNSSVEGCGVFFRQAFVP